MNPRDRDEFFRTEHLQQGLKRRSVRSGAITAGSQAFSFILRLGSTMVLARLLSPEDFGLVGMVTAISGFVSLFKDFGLSMATIQRDEISHEQVSLLFWVNVAVSFLIMCLFGATAPLVAWFYHEPRLTLITLAIAGSFLAGGLTVQHQALLRRQMRFGQLAVIDGCALMGGIILAVFAAWRGAGYWALVIQHWGMTLVNVVGVWIACGWRPGWPRRRSGARSMLAAGGGLTGFEIVSYIGRNADAVLIGRFLGSDSLGFYSRAYSLMLLPLQQITGPMNAVVLPALSRLVGDPVRYRRAVLSIVELLALVIMPGVAFLMVGADQLVPLVLGPQWSASVSIFMVLGIFSFVQPLAVAAVWIFITQGWTKRLFYWGLFNMCLVVGSVILGLQWGLMGVAVCYSVSGVVIRIPVLLWYVGRTPPMKTADFYKAVAPYTLVSVAVFLISWLTLKQIPSLQTPVGLFVLAIFMAGLYLGILWMFPFGRKALSGLRDVLGMLKSNTGSAPGS